MEPSATTADTMASTESRRQAACAVRGPGIVAATRRCAALASHPRAARLVRTCNVTQRNSNKRLRYYIMTTLTQRMLEECQNTLADRNGTLAYIILHLFIYIIMNDCKLLYFV